MKSLTFYRIKQDEDLVIGIIGILDYLMNITEFSSILEL